jgi:phosphate acetyltransferase
MLWIGPLGTPAPVSRGDDRAVPPFAAGDASMQGAVPQARVIAPWPSRLRSCIAARLARTGDRRMTEAPRGENRGENRGEKYRRLLDACRDLPPLPTAIAHPCDAVSLRCAVEARALGLIQPLLFGPEARIRRAAAEAGLDLADIPLTPTPHSHASAEAAVAAVRHGQAGALMKGSLHTDELMGAVVAREEGLRTARRISHCYVMDVPGRPDPLIISDAAVNIAPTLAEKADIVQNAIELAQALHFPEVRVAILSATESVNPKLPGTVEAAALCKMADRGQIQGGLVDGPLALDNAINPAAAAAKQIRSAVAGRANVLIVPDLEAGNMLAKSLSFLAGADAAGIVLGARVPIILTSRADSLITHLASCAVAVLVAAAMRERLAAKAV